MNVSFTICVILLNFYGIWSQSFLIAQQAGSIDAKIDQIQNISKELLIGIVDFWLEYGVDQELGGFYGELDSQARPSSSTDKTIVAQSRHLFAFSFLFYYLKNGLIKNTGIVIDTNRLETQMEKQFQFIVNSFVRSDNSEFPFSVSRDGKQVVDSKIRMYNTCFGIFGLSWYAQATNNFENRNLAVQIALSAFQSMDARLHDAEFGGYDQSREGNWLPNYASKGFNSHMHLLEALVPLHQVSQNQQVQDRIVEMIEVFMQHMIVGNFIATQYSRDWTAVSGDSVEYGHDLEAVVILLKAAKTVPYSKYPLVTIIYKILPVIQHSVDFGYDKDFGGFFKLGQANQYAISTNKEWWIQMEACLGLYEGYLLSGTSSYLDYLINTLTFVKSNLQSQFGGLYKQSDQSGNVIDGGLAGPYKASYHNLRALVTLTHLTSQS